MPNHIVLYEPEIPNNTGNIGRTCAATNTHLHLIKPLGFNTDDKSVRRAGLDYWPYINITYHDSIEDFFEVSEGEYYMLSKFGRRTHTDMDYTDTDENHYFVFGRESSGLPEWIKEEYKNTLLRVPMTGTVRSLNLANTASILIYEALRQQNYPELD